MTTEEAITELTELNHLRKAMAIQKERIERIKANMYDAKSITYDLAKVQTSNSTSRLEEDVVNLETEQDKLLDLVMRYCDLRTKVESNAKSLSYWSKMYISDVFVFGTKFETLDRNITARTVSQKALKEYAALRTAQGA